MNSLYNRINKELKSIMHDLHMLFNDMKRMEKEWRAHGKIATPVIIIYILADRKTVLLGKCIYRPPREKGGCIVVYCRLLIF